MNPCRSPICLLSRAIKLFILAGLAVVPARAATNAWDPNRLGVNRTEGSGAWSTNAGDTNWWNGVADVTWTNASDDAVIGGGVGGTAGTVTLGSSVVANSINLTNTASGTYTINLAGNALTFAGIAWATNAAISNSAGAGGLAISNTSAIWNGFNNGTLTVGAKITGPGRVFGAGSGSLVLANDANDFTGLLGKQNGGAITLSSIRSSGMASAAGAGSLVQIGFNGTINYTGPGDTTDRTLELFGTLNATLNSSGSGALVWAGEVSNASSGNLVFNVGGTNTASNRIVGNLADNANLLSVTKADSGTWILAGSNTYTGATTINGGTLVFTNGSAVADSGVITNANNTGALLQVNTSETIGSLRGGGASGGNVNLNGSGVTLTVAETGSQNFAGVISNTGGLTKTGAGTLTLSRTNTYTGPTTINAGVLRYGAQNIFADTGSVLIAGGSLDVSTFSDTIRDLSMSGGALNYGSGALTVTNSLSLTGGTVTATGSNSLSKIQLNTSVTSVILGSVTFDSTVSSGSYPGFGLQTFAALTVTNGSTVVFTNSGAGVAQFQTFGGARNVAVEANANMVLGWQITGNTTSVGGFNKSGAGTLALMSSNLHGGLVVVSAGTLLLGNNGALGFGATALDMQGASTLASASGATRTITNGLTLRPSVLLTLGQTSGGTGALIFSGGVDLVGNSSRPMSNVVNVTFAGTISNGGIVKSGVGTMTLSGSNNLTANTTLSEGTLVVNGATVGTNPITVSSGATLSGTGSAASVTANGTFAPGAVATNGTFTVTSSLNVPGNARFRVFGNGINDKVIASGGANLGGTVTVVVDTNYTPVSGNSFDLVDGAISGAPTLDLPALSGGLTWVTNAFLSTGVLSVTSPTNNYATWLTNYPSLTGTNALRSANPDGDPYDNGMEFAFDGNPTIGSPAFLTAANSGTNAVFNFVARKNPPGGATYQVQVTTNLAAGPWTNSNLTVSNSANQNGLNIPADYERREFVVPATGNGFYRVRAIIEP